jgi:olfactory receptor
MVTYFPALLLIFCPLAGILYLYSQVVSPIDTHSSAQGKYKAYPTCVSHLLVVSLYYCTGLGVYLSLPSIENSYSTRASVMYSVFTPILNPFIYSLRNKEIKHKLKRLVEIETIKGVLILNLKKDS